MISPNKTAEIFRGEFGASASASVWAPGRVNLLGEHTDYNEGYVLPLAVGRGIRVSGKPRSDRTVRLYSADYDQGVEFSLDVLAADPQNRWADYFKGTALELSKRGIRLTGCDAAIQGDLPRGAGLSSSAALEVASARFLLDLAGADLPDLDVVKAAQDAENLFVGVRCGIMDMYASYLGRAGNALLVDCRSLASRPAPLPEELKVVVCDTGVARTLAGSAYNERRAECEEAVRLLVSSVPGLRSLRDLSREDLERHGGLLPENVKRRARHVTGENQRVLDSVSAMERGDYAALGRLMNGSHASLRDDYQVSCKELDALAALAQGTPGVLGARMTGAGFGGCTVALVKAGGVDGLLAAVAKGYRAPSGRPADTYVFTASDGAKYCR